MYVKIHGEEGLDLGTRIRARLLGFCIHLGIEHMGTR